MGARDVRDDIQNDSRSETKPEFHTRLNVRCADYRGRHDAAKRFRNRRAESLKAAQERPRTTTGYPTQRPPDAPVR